MRATISLVTLLLLTAAPAGAQERIRVGQTVTGELTASDPADEDGARYDVYRFNGEAGAWYSITLRSDDFDAYLRVGSQPPDCGDCEEDDDDGGGLNAQVLYHPADDGRYQIHVTSFRSGEGAYTLTLEHAVMDTTVVDVSTSADTAVTEPAGGYAPVVPMGPGDLVAGVSVPGTLDPGDPQGEDGVWYDELTYAARAGESMVVTLESSDFDALVTVGQQWSGTWRELARDDDGGAGTNAELRYTFDADGLYAIRATAYRPSTGEYLLRLQSDVAGIVGAPGAADTFSAPLPPLADGRDVPGRLSGGVTPDGRYQELYRFSGRAGETVVLTLRSSEFDAYLVLLDATGEKVASDDDGGGGTDARLTLTLPESGEYQVRATSFDAYQTGAYTLRLDRR